MIALKLWKFSHQKSCSDFQKVLWQLLEQQVKVTSNEFHQKLVKRCRFILGTHLRYSRTLLRVTFGNTRDIWMGEGKTTGSFVWFSSACHWNRYDCHTFVILYEILDYCAVNTNNCWSSLQNSSNIYKKLYAYFGKFKSWIIDKQLGFVNKLITCGTFNSQSS